MKSHIRVAGLDLTTAAGKVESTFDDICVERMRAAGAIIVGTNTMMGAGGGARSDPDNPRAVSNWPDYWIGGRPRSATVVIRRRDGGIVGT